MNYADALEQNQQADRAWRLRRQLMQDEQRRQKESAAQVQFPDDMDKLRAEARIRLRMLARPGDPAYAALRELLRLDLTTDSAAEKKQDQQGLQHEQRTNTLSKLSVAARDSAFGWLLDTEKFDAARGWLWQRYTVGTSRPLWGEMRLALETADQEYAGELLDQYAPQIPRYDRIEAAKQAGDLRLAQSEAFAAQSEQDADDPLHQQLADNLLRHSHYVRGAYWNKRIDTVDEQDRNLRAHAALSPALTLGLERGSIQRDNRDTNVIGVTPNEDYSLMRLDWRRNDTQTRLTLAERNSFDNYMPLIIEHEQRLDKHLSLALTVAHNQPSSESTALRVAGMKDTASATLNYQLTRSDRLGTTYRYDKFTAQTDSEVGSGNTWQIEYAHAFRSEPRGLEIGMFYERHNYSQRTAAEINDPRLRPLLPANATQVGDVGGDFFVPNDFNFGGFRLSTDMNFEEDYSRAWRPYASVTRTWHSESGSGYDIAMGISGSIFGADHATVGWRMSEGGTSSSGPVREVGISYRLHF